MTRGSIVRCSSSEANISPRRTACWGVQGNAGASVASPSLSSSNRKTRRVALEARTSLRLWERRHRDELCTTGSSSQTDVDPIQIIQFTRLQIHNEPSNTQIKKKKNKTKREKRKENHVTVTNHVHFLDPPFEALVHP